MRRIAVQYQFQLEHAALVSAPVPGANDLRDLTDTVARNNFYSSDTDKQDRKVMKSVSKHIKHVIYVVKENRTYDQVLGDLLNGANGDSNLTQFGQSLTPNNHRLATEFVTLDNFMNPGDGSMDGWSWALQGRVTNTETLTQQINYAAVNRGLSYESEGTNRSVPVNFATVAERNAASGVAGSTNYSNASANLPGGTANLLTGTGNHASSDAPFGIEDGYIFKAVLKAGGTVRNYGFLVNNIGSIGTKAAPVSDPFNAGIVQVAPLDPALAPLTDVYFRGYDQNYPDLWRYNEWKREFDQVRRQSQSAQPVAGAHQPRPHGQLRQRAGRREHARNAAGRLRPRARPPGRSGGEQPLRRRHGDHRHRRRRAGWPRPRRLASRHRIRRRSVREAGRGRQHPL